MQKHKREVMRFNSCIGEKLMSRKKTDASKILLIGNGFTSQLIPAYKSKEMKAVINLKYPDVVSKIDSVWKDISATTIGVYDDINDLNYPYEVLDDIKLAIRDEEGVVPHSTHIEVDNLSRIREPIETCFIRNYGIDPANAKKIFNKFFCKGSSILRFQVIWSEVEAIEPFYALVKLAFRLNVIDQNEKNMLVRTIKLVLRNNDKFYFKDISNFESYLDGVQCFLNQYNTIFTTNYDQLLEISGKNVVHLHGSFLDDDIILGIDEIEKQNKNKRYSERVQLLRNIKCDEIHIFGYSGKNDIHINTAIRENGCKIVFYCFDNLKGKVNPTAEDIKIDELHNKKFHDCVKWSFGIPKGTKGNFVFKDRDEIWTEYFTKI